ncbi:MAG: hypothetical protein ACRD6X_14455 [Pyrinomonadaceae bacterium]
MTITIDLPTETEAGLRVRARNKGQNLTEFVQNVLKREAEPTLTELLKPIRDETKRLGLTERELEVLIDSELTEVRKITPLSSR